MRCTWSATLPFPVRASWAAGITVTVSVSLSTCQVQEEAGTRCPGGHHWGSQTSCGVVLPLGWGRPRAIVVLVSWMAFSEEQPC